MLFSSLLDSFSLGDPKNCPHFLSQEARRKFLRIFAWILFFGFLSTLSMMVLMVKLYSETLVPPSWLVNLAFLSLLASTGFVFFVSQYIVSRLNWSWIGVVAVDALALLSKHLNHPIQENWGEWHDELMPLAITNELVSAAKKRKGELDKILEAQSDITISRITLKRMSLKRKVVMFLAWTSGVLMMLFGLSLLFGLIPSAPTDATSNPIIHKMRSGESDILLGLMGLLMGGLTIFMEATIGRSHFGSKRQEAVEQLLREL